jgi:F0F1-type ATP synthase assembly protein I
MLKNKRNKKKQLNSYIKYSSLTTQMAVIISVGVFLGDYLDDLYNTDSKGYTIIFSLSSIFLALYYVIKKIINQNEKK